MIPKRAGFHLIWCIISSHAIAPFQNSMQAMQNPIHGQTITFKLEVPWKVLLKLAALIHKIFAQVDSKLFLISSRCEQGPRRAITKISYVMVYVVLQWIKHWVIELYLILLLFFVKFGLDKDHMLMANKQIIPLLNGHRMSLRLCWCRNNTYLRS